MIQQYRLPFRWLLPIAQLFLCFVVLWPVRGFLVFGIGQMRGSYASAQPQSNRLPYKHPVYDLPSLTAEQQKVADATAKRDELRMGLPLALDFPALVVQIPYILLTSAKREWTPQGMFPEVWRALSWPIAGLIFWWFAGRAIDALRAARRQLVSPRLGWIETVFAAILLCMGVVALAGIVTSTPDDRNDIQFMELVGGALLWGILASMAVTARFLQWRILTRSA